MKQKLQSFQQATVDQAIRALTDRSGSQRFLVADEVGLGKTVIAKAILESLAKRSRRRKKPFCVYYFANNLALLTQNRQRLEGSEESDGALQVACFPEDRLALGWSWAPQADLRVAIFTPSTSLPDLHTRSFSTGRRTERALSAAMVRLATGFPLEVRIRRFLAGVGTNSRLDDWGRLKLARFDSEVRKCFSRLSEHSNVDRRILVSAFVLSLFSQLEISGAPRGRRLRFELKSRISPLEGLNDRLATIRKALRIALCEMTIARRYLKPDLIILDEFHRYPEMLDAKPTSLGGKLLNRSSVLLLSATPFEFKKEQRREQPLADLARFLYRGKSISGDVETTLASYRKRVLNDVPSDNKQRSSWRRNVIKEKIKIENLLRPVMERTERWDDRKLVSAKDILTSHDLQVGELNVFEDFAERLRRAASRRKPIDAVSHSTPLWMSVPYPVQTLPSGYVASRALAIADRGRPHSSIARLRPPSGPPTAMRPALDHPKLRSLMNAPSQREILTLPWIAPSLPWWELTGVWANTHITSSKSLVFCHYRAAPPAIGGLISREIERIAGPTRLAWRDVPRKPRFAVGGSGPSKELLALFFPWRTLAGQFDPIAVAGLSKLEALNTVEQFLEKSLSKPHSISSLCQTEMRASEHYVPRTDIFASLFAGSAVQSTSLSTPDITYLANLTLGSPGVVLLRAFYRHYGAQIGSDIERDIRYTSWNYLRPYLGQRYFDQTLGAQGPRSRSTRRRAAAERIALLNAIIEGNLESVIDEHLSIWRQLNADRDSPKDALIELKKALDFKAGSLSLHERRKNKRVTSGRLRAHVAVAFSGQESAGPRDSSAELRPDTLRIAFNSPFWPHLLVTTSVGQEGLDFHVWCRRLVHWDVPPNPISLEQREGRITRYGSLAVRRAMALVPAYKSHVLATAMSINLASPWQLLKEKIESECESSGTIKVESGLYPWWVVPEGHHERLVLSPPFSHEAVRFKKMLEDLGYYRLAIGQPDPEKFVERLRGQISAEELRNLAIDLSGARLRST